VVRTIAVVARKGGAGKTTLAVHLAIAAHRAGRATLLADIDPQRSAVEVLNMRREGGPTCVGIASQGLMKVKLDAQASGIDALVVDTPAGTEEGMSTALVIADLALLVVRPTFLDLTAAVHTAEVLKKLRKPTLVILNQAPVARDGQEPPAVRQAKEVLRLMRLPVAPVILRARASYQTTVSTGRSAVELASGGAGAVELTQLWSFIEHFAFTAPAGASRLAAE
jgi:chromosome partitioning protein